MFPSKNTFSRLGGLWRRVCVCVCPAYPISFCVSMMFAAEELTISVSDTGPKLVTKIFVLISVTFSVERAQLRMSEAWEGHDW